MKPRTSILLLLATAMAGLAVWHVVDERAPFRNRADAVDALAAAQGDGNGGGFAVGALGMDQEQKAADAAIAAAGPAARFHPRAPSADNQRRIDSALATLQGDDHPTADYVKRINERLASEKPDVDWGRRVQMDLDAAYARQASLLHNLEVADSHCAQTVCALYAVAPGDSTQAPGADWQRFLGETFGQPQWRDQLTPKMTTVMTVDGRVVYVTYVERK
jgi:hypothetical protein